MYQADRIRAPLPSIMIVSSFLIMRWADRQSKPVNSIIILSDMLEDKDSKSYIVSHIWKASRPIHLTRTLDWILFRRLEYASKGTDAPVYHPFIVLGFLRFNSFWYTLTLFNQVTWNIVWLFRAQEHPRRIFAKVWWSQMTSITFQWWTFWTPQMRVTLALDWKASTNTKPQEPVRLAQEFCAGIRLWPNRIQHHWLSIQCTAISANWPLTQFHLLSNAWIVSYQSRK